MNCLVCGNAELEIFNKRPENIIYKCTSCDCIFNKEEISSDAFDSVTPAKSSIISQIKNNLIGFSGEIGAKSYYDFIKPYIGQVKRSLDIGSGYGHFVKILNKNGIICNGIESREQTKPYAVTKNIEYGFFDIGYPLKEKYDLICFSQMLYYNRNPIGLLGYAGKFLNPNGLIFIATMNTNSTYMDTMKNELPGVGTNLMLSKKNFANLKEFELVKYATVRANFSLEHHSSKNKYVTFAKYYSRLAKPFVEDPNGNYAYVLLRKTA